MAEGSRSEAADEQQQCQSISSDEREREASVAVSKLLRAAWVSALCRVVDEERAAHRARMDEGRAAHRALTVAGEERHAMLVAERDEQKRRADEQKRPGR